MSLKNNLFSLLFMASFLFSGLSATVAVDSSSLFIPTSLNGVRLLHDENGFTIEKDGDMFPIKAECMDRELVNVSDEELDFLLGLKAKIEIDGKEQILIRISPKLTQNLIIDSHKLIKLDAEDAEKINSQLPASSYIQIFQFSDGEYGLHLKTRLPGGGPLFGHATYWIVKGIVGAVIVIGAGAIVVGTGGLAAPLAAGGLAGAAAGGTAAATGLAAAGAAGVGAGAVATVATGAAMGAAGAAGAAALTTGAAIASVTAATTLGVGGTLAATEAVATAAGLIVGCLPTP